MIKSARKYDWTKPSRPWRRPPGKALRPYMISATRWWIANTLNRLPGQCWSSLVNWALLEPRQPGFWERPRCGVTSMCVGGWSRRPGDDPPDACYCGKVNVCSSARVFVKGGGDPSIAGKGRVPA